MERREFFRRSGSFAAIGLLSQLIPGSLAALGNVLDETPNLEPAAIAQDEAFWRKIRSFYVPPTDVIDLDHANTSPMSSTVFDAFAKRSRRLSQAPAERLGELWMETGKFRPELAKLLGTKENHFALTTNATFALNTVLHGFPLTAGDEVLVTNHEYPDMIEVILQRTKRDGVVMKSVDVAALGEDKLALVERVKKAITPKTKLLLISHVSAWSGEILPVAEVTKVARERGVAVLVDAAQSVGMLDVNFEQIGCDFLATSLHKWMGGPLTTGVLVMKPEHVGKVWPLHPPSWETTEYPMDIYEWTGSVNMAANASIGEALSFQKMLGPARKLARMLYLGNYWQDKLHTIPKVKLLTPSQADRAFGVAVFAVEDMPSSGLMRYLRKEKGILIQDKAGRHSPFKNALRVSPGPYTTPSELDRFVVAVKRVLATGLPAEYKGKPGGSEWIRHADYSVGLAMESWRTIRKAVLRRDDFRCQACMKPTVGQVHHIVPAGLGGSSQPSNLMTLCGRCHMLVSPVPDWVIRKVWNIPNPDISSLRLQANDAIAAHCLRRKISNKSQKSAFLSHKRETNPPQFAEQIHWLNAYLSLVYDTEVRISMVLRDLGFDEKELLVIRSQNLEQFVNSCVAAITDRLFGFTDGERLFIILNRRLKVDGLAPDTLQSLGERLEISRERVRQLEVKALRRCTHRANKDFIESTFRYLAKKVLEYSEQERTA